MIIDGQRFYTYFRTEDSTSAIDIPHMCNSPCSAPFLRLPGELVTYILSYLDVHDVWAMRQTCLKVSRLTRTQSIWLAFYRRQLDFLPFASHTCPPSENVDSLSSSLPASILESNVTSANRIAKLWPLRRRQRPLKLEPRGGLSLHSCQLISDRWLVCASSEGVVQLWDISHSPTDAAPGTPLIRLFASSDLGSKDWASMTAALDPQNNAVLIVMSRASIPVLTQIFRVQLPGSESQNISGLNDFKLLFTQFNNASQLVKSIEPDLRLVITSSVSSVNIMCLDRLDISPPSLPDTSMIVSKTRTIAWQTDGLHELLNVVIVAHLMGPYIVLLRSLSIELHPSIEAKPSTTLETIQYHFQRLTFRMISSSDCVLTDKDLSFTFLGYDVLQGIYQYSVRVRFMPDMPAGATLDVECIGTYPMRDTELSPHIPFSQNLDVSGGIQVSQESVTSSYPGTSGPTGGRGNRGVISRGFISAMAMGPQGKRAVWVERKRGSTNREVLVWSTPEPGRDEQGSTNVLPRQVVYQVESYDLREDITHCAIGEVSGTIILGNRIGNVFVLRP